MIIKYDVVFDRTEYALIQADLMKKEAQRLNFEEGIILSDSIKANVYTNLDKDENVIDITASIISRDNVPYRDLLLAYLYQATAYIGLNDFDNAEIPLDYAKALNENEIKKGGAINRNHLAANVMNGALLMAEVYVNSKK